MTVTLYWCDNGEDHLEPVASVEAAYARGAFVVRAYKRSVWFWDECEPIGFVRLYMHSRSVVETEKCDLDMVPKVLQLIHLLEV